MDWWLIIQILLVVALSKLIKDLNIYHSMIKIYKDL